MAGKGGVCHERLAKVFLWEENLKYSRLHKNRMDGAGLCAQVAHF